MYDVQSSSVIIICLFLQPSEDHHKLTCYYYDAGRNPRLIIRPVKVEVMYPDPKIYVLREVISEKEMARLRELAAPIVSIPKWKWLCLLLRLGLPSQAMGWLLLRFGIGGSLQDNVHIDCTLYADIQ